MSSGITVAIKIEHKCLKDFIITQYSLNKTEPVSVTSSNKLASLFLKHISKAPINYKPVFTQTDGVLLFELPYNDGKNIRCNYFINETKQRRIVDFFDSEFKMQFRMFMNENLGKTISQLQDAIYEFTRIYEIDCSEDTFELLKKDYYRYRLRLKKPLLKIRGVKTYKQAILKRKILTTSEPVLSQSCP
jgi:hypothetical protein